MSADVVRPRGDERSATDDRRPFGRAEEGTGKEGESELGVDTVGIGGTRVKHYDEAQNEPAKGDDVFRAQWESRGRTVRDNFPRMTDKDVGEVKGSKSTFMQKLMEHYHWTRSACEQKVDMWTGGDLDTYQ